MSDKKERLVGNREVTWFLVTLFISKILFSDITGYVSKSGTAAYMQTALCFVAAFVVFGFTVFLSGRGTDLLGAAEEVGGKAFVKALGVLLTLIFLADAGVMMRVYTDIISSIALPESSDLYIMVFLIVAVVFVCYAGVGVLASYSYAAGIILVVSLAVILTLNIPNYDYTNIYPVLGNGVKEIVTGIGGISVYADILLIYLITPYLKKGTSVKETGLKAILISGVAITVTTFLYIMTVEYPFSQNLTLPILEIAFDVNLDVIFQRAEGVFFFLWIFSGFIVIGAYLSFALMSFVRSFNLTDRRAPIALFVLLVSIVALSAETSASHSMAYSIFYSVFAALAFLIPILVFGIRRIKRK